MLSPDSELAGQNEANAAALAREPFAPHFKGDTTRRPGEQTWQ